MKKTILFTAVFVCSICSISFAQNQVTLTTYYPAPFGMYQEMRVMGRLGVGTTNPTSPLHATGGGWNTTTAFFQQTVPLNMIGIGAPGSALRLSVLNTGVYGLYVDQPDTGRNYIEGRLGIGTASPNKKLDVAGTARIGDRTDKHIIFENSDIHALNNTGGNTLELQSLWNQPAGDTVLNRYSGKVGIGVDAGAPGSLLEISGTTGVTQNEKGLRLTNRSLAYPSINLFPGSASPHAGMLTFGDGSGWKFHFAKNSDSGSTKFMTLQDNGRVGIGTTVPGATLDLTSSGTFKYSPPSSGGDASYYGGEWVGNNSDMWIRKGAWVECPAGQYLFRVYTVPGPSDHAQELRGACRNLSAP